MSRAIPNAFYLGFEDGNVSASAFNNDCDRDIDEDAVCLARQTCDRGHCTTSCSGEFPCPASLICDRGHCVAEVCATGISCPSDTVCRGSACVSPCDGILAPDRSGSTKELWALLSALGIATFVGLRRSARARRS